MASSLAFGCPECGRRIDLGPNSPGRRVRCGRCGTLVEVPFFPRQFGRKRPRNPRWKAWLPIGLVALVVFVGPMLAWLWWHGSTRSGLASRLGQALSEIDEAERRGDPSAAFLAAEEARTLALRHGLEPPGGLSGLVARRDELARREVEARLGAIPALPADRALVEAKDLAHRIEADPTLLDLAGRSRAAIADASGRWVDQHLERAEACRGSGRSAEALATLERLASGLVGLPAEAVAGPSGRVLAFAGELIAGSGARVGPIEAGSGSAAGSIEEELAPILAGALADRGYVVPGPGSPLAGLSGRAPFRLRATVVEQPGNPYLQTPNRTTSFAVDLALDRDDKAAWSEHFEARTRVPLPGLAAMEASRLALADRRSPEVEDRFRRDARADLVEKLRLKLRALPPAPGRASP